LLDLTQKAEFDQSFFEVASALGTVGLSMGITSSLTALGKIFVIILMMCGRLGPLTFAIALFARKTNPANKGDNDLAV